MRGFVEHIYPDRIVGWAYDEDNLAIAVHVIAKANGRAIGTAMADHYRSDLAKWHPESRCGFVLEIEPLENMLAVLGKGALAVEAQSPGSAERFELQQRDAILPQQVLRSSRLFFGDTEGGEFLELIRLLARRTKRAANNTGYCLHLLNYARAYFPPNARDREFLALGVELAEAARAPHTARYYRAELEGNQDVLVSAAEQVPFETVPTYATLSDLIPVRDDQQVALETALFIDGARDHPYVDLCELFPSTEQPSAMQICPLIIRVNSFDDTGWFVTKGQARHRVLEQVYFVDFEQIRRAVVRPRIIIIDMSAEGPEAIPSWCAIMNEALIDLRIPTAQTLFVSQNLAFGVRAPANTLRVHVGTANYNLHKALAHAASRWGAEDRLVGHIQEVLGARRDRPKIRKYVCLNFTPRWPRWATVLSLSFHGLLPEGYVSFPGGAIYKHNPSIAEAYLMPAIRHRQFYLNHLPEFLKLCPLVLDRTNEPAEVLEHLYPTHIFADSLIHIVTETEMGDDRVRRVTEKVFKPMVGLQPFLVFGNPGSLDILRKLGFKTFGGLFDESYDRIAHPAQRFDAVEAEMLRCLALDVNSLRDAVNSFQDVVVHNFVHLVRIAPTIFSKGVRSRLHSRIVQMHADLNGILASA